MVSERLLNELNEQVKYEFESSHLYFAMAGYFADQDLPGFENFFLVQAEEEREHGMKIYHFINEIGARAVIRGFDTPQNNYESVLEAVKAGLDHEQFVTDRIHLLMDIAVEEKNYAVSSMLQWFVDEQVEELDTFRSLLAKVERVGQSGKGLYMLDKELAARK